MAFVLIKAFRGQFTSPGAYLTKREGVFIAVPVRFGILLSSFAMILYTNRSQLVSFATIPLSHTIRYCFIPVTLFGILLLNWTLETLGRNYSMSLFLKKDHELITRGPYAYVRHPMYTCLLVIFTSMLFVSGNALVAAGGIITTFTVMAMRTVKEEELMREHFGDKYDKYCKQVPNRYIPYII